MRPTSIALAALLSAAALSANTYTVTSTADSGAGTLRQAILDANAHAGADTNAFNITGSGVHTIAPTADLPAITDAVTIDGYTQPGAETTAPGARSRADRWRSSCRSPSPSRSEIWPCDCGVDTRFPRQ